MSVSRFSFPFFQAFASSTGNVGAGWKLYFWKTGTTDEAQTTYSDSALTTANANPVEADANGRWSDIFLQDALYAVELTDENDVQIAFADPVGSDLVTTIVGKETERVTVASDGQTTLTLTGMTYTPGSNMMLIFRNGAHIDVGVDIQETTSTTFTWIGDGDLSAGDEFTFIKNQTVSSSAVLASNVSYTPPGSGAVATDVQTQLRKVYFSGNYSTLQQALNAAAGSILYIEGSNQITASLTPSSNTLIEFLPGASVSFAAGSSVSTGDAIFLMDELDGVTIKLHGATLTGERKGTGTDDIVQGISVLGCTNTWICGPGTIQNCAGDGILIGPASDNTPIFSENVWVNNMKMLNCMRNGVAITSVKNCWIRDSIWKGTNGKDPEAGIDIEPDGSTAFMENVNIVNCVGSDNEQFDFELVLGGNATPITNDISVRLLDCTAENSTTYTTTIGLGILNHRAGMISDGFVHVRGFKARNINNHGLMIRNIDKDGTPVELHDIELIDTALTSAVNMVGGQDTPCMIYTNTAITDYEDPGNVHIHGLRIVDDTRDRAPYYVTSSGNAWDDLRIYDLDWVNTVGTTTFPFADAGSDFHVTWVNDLPYTVNRTSNLTLSTRYSGWRLTNNGASGAVVFTLPGIAASHSETEFRFYVEAAQTLRVDPDAADTIHVLGNGDGKYIEASTVGTWIKIKYFDADGWEVETNNVAGITAEP